MWRIFNESRDARLFFYTFEFTKHQSVKRQGDYTMTPFFQIDILGDDLKLNKKFLLLSDRLYYQKKKRSLSNWIFLIGWGFIVLNTLLIFSEPHMVSFLVIAAWCLAFSARLRRRAFLNLAFFIRTIIKRFGKHSLINSQIKFFVDDFSCSFEKEPLVLKYSVIDKLAEDSQGYYLFFSEERGAFFSKHCFTVGNPLEFKEFIIQKTGKNMDEMK